MGNRICNILKIAILFPYLATYLVCCYIRGFFQLFSRWKKSLNGETILITGCGTGIGKLLAVRLSEMYKDKISLVLWDINQSSLEDTVQILLENGTLRVFPYCVDISKPEQVVATAKMVHLHVGNITVLINNAGVSYNRDFLNLTPVEIEKTLSVNYMAHFSIIKEFLPNMIEKKKGHIVATCSVGGHVGLRGNVPYFASKFAIRGAMTALREEVQFDHPDKTGLHFTTVYPWFVKTPLLDQLNIKLRFPKLMPLLEPAYVAKKIVDGIESNLEHIFVPPTFKASLWMLRIVPEVVRSKILDFMILEYRGE
ncbi:short-chain dehydrogenase/reductase family 16C member 6 isoform X1 [Folsomia candida]|uniref:short-chain dehydrogenase/reductase family 16C member 6 isoform X1 n=1 Tax=Folsomia candida TaxID=158441 RepID=UPI000B8EEC12|nr:short-chain dehydrogenase/reductase family 16C member 6 isoform X1 [Folsomia candida]